MSNLILVGAGSSVCYGFPLWGELFGLIKNKVKSDKELHEIRYYNPKPGDFPKISIIKGYKDLLLLECFLNDFEGKDTTIDEAVYEKLTQFNDETEKNRFEEIFWLTFKKLFFLSDEQRKAFLSKKSTRNEIFERLRRINPSKEDRKYHLEYARKYDIFNLLKNSIIVDYNYDHVFKDHTNCIQQENWECDHNNEINYFSKQYTGENFLEASKAIAFDHYFQPHGHFNLDDTYPESESPRYKSANFPSIANGEGAMKRVSEVNGCIKTMDLTNLILFGLGPIATKNAIKTLDIPPSIRKIYYTCYDGKLDNDMKTCLCKEKTELYKVNSCSDLWDKLAEDGLVQKN